MTLIVLVTSKQIIRNLKVLGSNTVSIPALNLTLRKGHAFLIMYIRTLRHPFSECQRHKSYNKHWRSCGCSRSSTQWQQRKTMRASSGLWASTSRRHTHHIKIPSNQVTHHVPFLSADIVQPAHPPGRCEDGHDLANRLGGYARTSLKEAANGVADYAQLLIQDQSFR